MIINSAGFFFCLIHASFMVDKFTGWLIYLPALLNQVSIFQNSDGWFKYDICHVARLYFSSGLVFNMYEMSVMHSMWTILYLGLHFTGPFARLLVLEIYTISYLEGWFFSCHGLLSCLRCFLIYCFFLLLPMLIYVHFQVQHTRVRVS